MFSKVFLLFVLIHIICLGFIEAGGKINLLRRSMNHDVELKMSLQQVSSNVTNVTASKRFSSFNTTAFDKQVMTKLVTFKVMLSLTNLTSINFNTSAEDVVEASIEEILTSPVNASAKFISWFPNPSHSVTAEFSGVTSVKVQFLCVNLSSHNVSQNYSNFVSSLKDSVEDESLTNTMRKFSVLYNATVLHNAYVSAVNVSVCVVSDPEEKDRNESEPPLNQMESNVTVFFMFATMIVTYIGCIFFGRRYNTIPDDKCNCCCWCCYGNDNSGYSSSRGVREDGHTSTPTRQLTRALTEGNNAVYLKP